MSLIHPRSHHIPSSALASSSASKSGLKERGFLRGYSIQPGQLALSLLLLLAVSLHLPDLPWWTAPALLLLASTRLLPAKPWSAFVRLTLLAALIAGLGLSFGWKAGIVLHLSLLAVLVLKWAEQRTPIFRKKTGRTDVTLKSRHDGINGETALIAAGTLVVLATGGLYWQNLGGLFLTLAGIALWVFTLAASASTSVSSFNRRPYIGNLSALAKPGGLVLRALPLAVALFMFFPRIPGPLWDIGLTLGLPLSVVAESKPQGLGIGRRFALGAGASTPGTVGPQPGGPILVAEFDGWVPETTRLYWRGPVFYDFDGKEWQLADIDTQRSRLLAEGWNQGKAVETMLRGASQRVEYSIRLSPHGENGLYALDVPSRLTSESYVSPDLQLRSMTPVRHEMTYTLASWLNFDSVVTPLPNEQRARALALPPGNPRLKTLGETIAREHPDEDERARALLIELAGSLQQEAEGKKRFRFSERFQLSNGIDALDDFWFDGKTGNAALYAGAFAVLARAAGLPSRVVTGFRGGKLMALTNYVVVKNQHAHAWTELWIDGKGWVRFDPSSAVAPERFEGDAARKTKALSAPTARLVQPLSMDGMDGQTPTRKPAGDEAEKTAGDDEESGSGWSLPDIAGLLDRWVIHFDAGKQAQQMKEIGWQSRSGEKGGISWITLLGWLAGVSAAIWLCGTLFARWREAHALPPAERLWRRYQARLAPIGLAAAPGECPSRHAERLAALSPGRGDHARHIAGHYLAWRYGNGGQPAAHALNEAIRRLIQSL